MLNMFSLTAFFLSTSIFALELYLYSFYDPGFDLLGIRPYFNTGRIDHFIDLQVVTLNGIDCIIPLQDIYSKSCYVNPTNIPKFFISAARMLSIGSDHTNLVGFLMGMLTISSIAIFYQYSLGGWQSSLTVLFVVGSFPFRLALERGNIDLIILSLLLVSVTLLSFSNRRKNSTNNLFVILSILFIALGTLGKVYPILVIPVVPLISAFCGGLTSNSRSNVILISLLTAIFSAVLLLPDLAHMTSSSYREISGGLGYGLLVSPDQDISPLLIIFIKAISISLIPLNTLLDRSDFFGVRYSAKLLVELLNSPSSKHRMVSVSFLYGLSIFIGTYMVFVNGIYRLSVAFSLMGAWFALWFFANWKTFFSQSQGALFVIFSVLVVNFAGYRPYHLDSNIQHLTQLFVEYVLFGVVCGYLLSVFFASLCLAKSARRLLA